MPARNQQEAAADVRIRRVLDLRRYGAISRPQVERYVWQHVGVFAPRCNCGAVLRVERQVGRALVSCSVCGHRNWEI